MTTSQRPQRSRSPRLSIENAARSLLWLMGFAGAFVFIEPSPYEIVGALAIVDLRAHRTDAARARSCR